MRMVLMVLIAGWFAVAGSLAAQSAERRVTGAEVRVNVRGYTADVRGELLAVMGDTVWVQRVGAPGSVPFAFDDVIAARVRAHGAGDSWTMRRVFMGWGATSLGLMVACVQAEAADCSAVLLVMAIPWGIIGGVAAISNESGTWLRFLQEELTALRPYSRFPQGLPASLRPRATLQSLHPDP